MSIAYASEQLEKKFPAEDGLAFARRAEALFREQWTDEAFQILTEGVQKHPAYVTGFVVLGRLYKETGRLVDATSAFEKALGLDATCPAALQGLAQISEGLQAYGESARLFAALAAREPWDAEFQSSYQRALGFTGGNASARTGAAEEPAITEFNLNDVADFLPKGETAADMGLETENLAPVNFEAKFHEPPSEEARATTLESTPVTGQDVESRLDTIFGLESSSPTTHAEQNFSSAPEPAPEAAVIYVPPTEAEPEKLSETSFIDTDRIEGSDIEKRLDDLFTLEPETAPEKQPGSETSSVETDTFLTSDTETSAVENAPITGEDVEKQLDHIFSSTKEEPSAILGISATQMAAAQPEFAGLEDQTLAMPAFASDPAQPPPAIPAERASATAWSTPEPSVEESILETADLRPATETGAYDINAAGSGDAVVGDDISQRLDQLFGLESDEMPAPSGSIGDEPGTSETAALSVETAPPGNSEVSGADVEHRLNEIFGDEAASETASLAAVQSSPEGNSGVSGADVENRLNEIFGDEAHSETASIEAVQTSSVSNSEVSGADVESRLTEIFGYEDAASLESPTPAEAGPHPSQTLHLSRAAIFGDDESPTGETESAPAVEPMLEMEEESDAEEPEASAEPPNVATVTLAEIYFQQGLREQALQIYRQLLEREPDNETVRNRIGEIEAFKSEDEPRSEGSDADRRQPRPGLKVPRRKK